MNRPRRLYPQELEKISQAPRAPIRPIDLSGAGAPSVTVLLLSLDRLHLTRRCVESVYECSDYPFQMLIVDNGSRPETVDYLKSLEAARDNLRVVYHPANVGVARGRNRGFSLAATDHVFTLDNDTVCHPGFLREAVACAMRFGAPFVGALRLNGEGSVWAAAAELIRTNGGKEIEIARWFHDLPLDLVQRLLDGLDIATNFLSGGAGLYSREAFYACGGFSPNYFVGFEDIDFSLRLAERGYRVRVAPRCVLTHVDDWLPRTEADVEYARVRYDLERLRRSAEEFQAAWGLEVLPEKYADAFEKRFQSKLAGKSGRVK